MSRLRKIVLAVLTVVLLSVSVLGLMACDGCGDDHEHTAEHVNGVAPTCITTGIQEYWVCTDITCSKMFSDEGCENEIAQAVILPALGHEFLWVEDLAATMYQEGIKHQECSRCQARAEEGTKLAMLTHIHDMQVTETITATCMTRGHVTEKCSTCGYQKTTFSAALGHSYNTEERVCEQSRYCTRANCGEVEEELQHDYQEISYQAKDCVHDEETVYECSLCGDTYLQKGEVATGVHTVSGSWTFVREEATSNKCIVNRVESAYCSVCEDTVERKQPETKHSEMKYIKTKATCMAEGTYGFKCSVCGEKTSDDSTYPIDTTAHTWGETSVSSAVTTYSCTNNGCMETKTVVDKSAEKTATVDADSLTSAGGIKLDGAEMKLDSIALSGDVTISADTVPDKSTLGLDEDKLAQIGDNPVYDFSLTDGTNNIDFNGGSITITLPYELDADESVDGISVWYIDSEGEVSNFDATYFEDANGNGFVTFTTTHFSYYTVTRLTPAERCALYGHSDKQRVIPATCTSDGYTITICLRCGEESEKTEINPATRHRVAQNGATVQPTCTAYGYTNYRCENENCNYAYQKRTPATGHNLVKDTVKSITATCTVEGRDVFYCDNDGCSAKTSKNLGKKDHNFTTTDIAPTCVEPGKSTHVCKVCAFSYEDGHLNPTGHNYKEEKVEATCTQDGYIMHKCSNTGCTAGYQTGTIKAHHTWNVEEPTCIGQTCIHCGATGLPAVKPHTMGENGICTVCGAGCEHTYVDTVVAPTCTTDGYTLSKCSACGVEKKGTVVKATGHIGTYTCSVCNQSILPENFFINGFESMMEGNLTIRLTDVIIDESTSFNKIFKDSVTVQFAELVLGVENGKIIGYGGGKLYASFNGDTPVTVEMYAVIENDTLYVELKNLPDTSSNRYSGDVMIESGNRLSGAASQTVTFTDTYYAMPLSVMLNEMLGFSADDTGVQLVEKLIGWLETDLRPLISTLLNANKAKISEITVAGITELFNFEQQSNGYRISLNYEKLKAFNDKLAENKVSDVIDSVFGAESYANLKTKVLELPDMTVGQLLDKTVEYGLTTDQLLTVVDNFVKIITNGEFETLQALLIDEGVLDDDEDINELLNNKRIKKAKLGYLFSEIVGGDEEDIKEGLAEVFNILETETLYEIIGIEKEEVNEVIEAMQSSFEISAYTATDGKFVEFSVKATELDIDGVKLGFKASILNDASATYDYAQKLQEAKTNVNVLKLTDKNYQKAYNAGAWKRGNYDNKDFIPEFDANGNLIAWTREYIDEFYADRVIEQTDDYVIFEHCSVYTMSMRVEMKNAQTSVTKACGDWWEIYCHVYSGKYFGGYWYTNCVVKQDKSNGSIEIISYGEQKENNRGYNRSDYYNVLYNSKTGEFASINGNDTHTWQLDASQSTAPIGCTGIGKNYYVCSECDEFKIEYLANGHTDVQRAYILLGEDCYDGVTVTETCLTCGAVEQYTTYNHAYTYEYLDLSGYNGACEEHNRIYRSTCPCGEHNYVHTGGNLVYHTGSRDSYGNSYSSYYCQNCELNFAKKETVLDDGCNHSEFAVYNFYWGTEKIAEFEMVESYDNHYYAETTYTLLEGATSCSDGVVATSICKHCEKVRVNTYYYHNTTHQCIGIKDGDTTIGEVVYYGCLCGERVEGFYVNGYASILDDEENVIKYVFSNGDIVREEWTERIEGCYVYRDVTVTLPNGTTFSYTENDYKHNMVTTAELINGATSCEDGVRINIKCSECNYYTDNYVAYMHRAVISEEINLQSYGATCATGIQVEKCACGQIRGWDFADLDSDACDFDVDVYSSYNSNQDKQVYTYKGVEYTTGMWKLHGTWHLKYTEFLEMCGGAHIGDMFYRDDAAVLMTCAVTDPQCTLQIFYGQKYTNANCTEKVDYVLVVFVGGVEKLSYSWTESYSSGHSASAWEFTPDAEGSCYGTYTQKCVNCNHVMYQYKGYEHTVERTWISKCAYTLKCTACQKKFNSVYYAHNFVDDNEDPCLRNEYCTQCGVQGYSGTDHNIMTNHILVKEATCSQMGIMKYKKWCDGCEEVMLEYEYKIWPNGHSYSYNSQTGISDCSRCGIENINGADGVIILEDCTENLSTATEIKVGYFIKKFKNNFTQNVSIMVGEEQIVIQDIQIVKEGDSYVKFSKAEVIAWATANGHAEGTYDIRLSFVPIGNATNLDYAITFTADELWG